MRVLLSVQRQMHVSVRRPMFAESGSFAEEGIMVKFAVGFGLMQESDSSNVLINVMTQFNPLQIIKRRFFAMRNGVLADTLRKGGSPYKIIFGLNLPQIKDIAREHGADAAMGRRLWSDCRTRESMLLAPWLFADGDLAAAEAVDMIDTAVSAEAIDIFAMAHLRRQPWAGQLLDTLLATSTASDERRYAALRLAMNLADEATLQSVKSLAETVASGSASANAAFSGPLRSVARQVINELMLMAMD